MKLLGPDLGLVRTCRAAATFDFCPILVTGGITAERIPDAVSAGAILVGAGFDLLLGREPKDVSPRRAAEVLTACLEAARSARDKAWPELAAARGAGRKTWLGALPHHHPF